MGLLYLASSRSSLITDGRVSDKLMHVLAYMLLGTFVLRALHGGVHGLRLWPTVLAFLVTVIYGISDELHQLYVPGRVGSVSDGFADALGAGLAILLMGFLGALCAQRAKAAP